MVEESRQRKDQDFETLRGEKLSLEKQVEVLTGELHRLRSLQKLLAETVQKMAVVSRISQELNRLDTGEIKRITMERIPGLINARLASLYLFDEEKRQLILFASNHPYPIDETVELEEARGTVMANTVSDPRIRVYEDLSSEEGGLICPHASNYQSRTCISAPLFAAGRVVGVLNFADRMEGVFDQMNDLVVIEPLATVLGIAIHNGQLHEEAQRQARRDPMTGLYNHSVFFAEFEREVWCARSGRPLSLVMIDIDDFKQFNDTYGHQAGDLVIEGVAEQILEWIRSSDIAGRYGGDEFAVVLPGSPLAGGEITARRILQGVQSRKFEYREHELTVSLSIGVTQYQEGETGPEFMKRGDEALYRAKREGKGRLVLVPPLEDAESS